VFAPLFAHSGHACRERRRSTTTETNFRRNFPPLRVNAPRTGPSSPKPPEAMFITTSRTPREYTTCRLSIATHTVARQRGASRLHASWRHTHDGREYRAFKKRVFEFRFLRLLAKHSLFKRPAAVDRGRFENRVRLTRNPNRSRLRTRIFQTRFVTRFETRRFKSGFFSKAILNSSRSSNRCIFVAFHSRDTRTIPSCIVFHARKRWAWWLLLKYRKCVALRNH